MDIDVFPNTIDDVGPNGMVFLRDPHLMDSTKQKPPALPLQSNWPGNDIDPGNVSA